jgi:anti-sigma B factor antagonist
MEIHIKTIDQVVVVEIIGDIDGKTAPEAREAISAQIHPGVSILLDMTGVEYMSSAGLRVLLATYRQVKSNDGRIVLVGLSEEIEDTMSMTGFLRFFTACETVEEGLAALE